MKSVIKKFITILIIFTMIFILKPKTNIAISTDDAGKAIAGFAMYFYNQYGNRVVYLKDTESRAEAYNEEYVGSLSTYYLDYVGFTSYAIHKSTGLDSEKASNGTGFFVAEASKKIGNTKYFDDITGLELEPGDILANGHQVMIYVGNDMIVYLNEKYGLVYQSMEYYGNYVNNAETKYGPGTHKVYAKAYRMKSKYAEELDAKISKQYIEYFERSEGNNNNNNTGSSTENLPWIFEPDGKGFFATTYRKDTGNYIFCIEMRCTY